MILIWFSLLLLSPSPQRPKSQGNTSLRSWKRGQRLEFSRSTVVTLATLIHSLLLLLFWLIRNAVVSVLSYVIRGKRWALFMQLFNYIVVGGLALRVNQSAWYSSHSFILIYLWNNLSQYNLASRVREQGKKVTISTIVTLVNRLAQPKSEFSLHSALEKKQAL